MSLARPDVKVGYVADLVQAAITARDFCGNEIEAMQQEAADLGLGKLSDIVIEGLQELVDREWRKWQKAAGVKAKYWK